MDRDARPEGPAPSIEQAALDLEAPGREALVRNEIRRSGWQVIDTVEDFRGRKNVLELFDVEADSERRNDLSAEKADRARVLQARKRTLRRVLEQAGTQARPADLDPALRARLEALGYSIK